MAAKFFAFFSMGAGAAFIYAGRSVPENSGNSVPGVLFLLVGVVILLCSGRKKPAPPQRTAAPAPAPAPAPKPTPKPTARASVSVPDYDDDDEDEDEEDDVEKTITFRAAGTTFDNDDGSSRQDILRHLKYGDPPYARSLAPLVVDFNQTLFGVEDAIEITINDYMIGFVPKKLVARFSKILDDTIWTVENARIIGGGRSDSGKQLSYGCEITVSYIII